MCRINSGTKNPVDRFPITRPCPGMPVENIPADNVVVFPRKTVGRVGQRVKKAGSTTAINSDSEGKTDATVRCTLTAVNHCNSTGTAARSAAAEESGQGRNRPAEGQGRSHRRLAASPCPISAPKKKTCARDASTQQTRLRCAHIRHNKCHHGPQLPRN